MNEQNPFDRQHTDAAVQQPPRQPTSGGMSRPQIQALLGDDVVATSRRAFLAATLAAGTTAAVAGTVGASSPVPSAGSARPSLRTRLTRD